jgi:L-2-hydroxyglutarate oxidase LhgO
MEQVDCVVVGAGVVGLAVARELALAGREVLVLEAAEGIGTGTSSRNSEVIHAGIYYPAGSLQARSCVEGRELLYAYCRERALPHSACGKLIVATDAAEAHKLVSIQARAAANGVALHLLTREQALAMEPALHCTAALHSPSTGIIDSHAFMLSLQGDAEHAGATFCFHTPVLGGHVANSGIAIECGGAEPMRLLCRTLVNSAGLHAPELGRAIRGMPEAQVPGSWYAKGNYFSLTGKNPFSRLIYPVPVPGGLGTHLTIDLGGQARFGPDVEWVETLDYEVRPERGASFYESIRRYWPGLPDGALSPGYAGIRPKTVPPGALAQDFAISGPREHGIPGLVHLFGIESPGLTASLALARQVAQALAA